MNSPKRLARTAGMYYLVVAVLGAFAHLVHARIYVPDDAAASAENVMVHQLGAILVATDPANAAALGVQGSEALVLLLELQHNGYLIAQIFFGLWLFPLGLLAYRSRMFPRLLAQLLMVASAGYLLDVALQFLAPERAAVVSPGLVTLFAVSEGSMLIHLLVRGVRTVRRPDHALVVA